MPTNMLGGHIGTFELKKWKLLKQQEKQSVPPPPRLDRPLFRQ